MYVEDIFSKKSETERDRDSPTRKREIYLRQKEKLESLLQIGLTVKLKYEHQTTAESMQIKLSLYSLNQVIVPIRACVDISQYPFVNRYVYGAGADVYTNLTVVNAQ